MTNTFISLAVDHKALKRPKVSPYKAGWFPVYNTRGKKRNLGVRISSSYVLTCVLYLCNFLYYLFRLYGNLFQSDFNFFSDCGRCLSLGAYLPQAVYCVAFFLASGHWTYQVLILAVTLFIDLDNVFQCCGSGTRCLFVSEIRNEHPGSYFRELGNNFFG